MNLFNLVSAENNSGLFRLKTFVIEIKIDTPARNRGVSVSAFWHFVENMCRILPECVNNCKNIDNKKS